MKLTLTTTLGGIGPAHDQFSTRLAGVAVDDGGLLVAVGDQHVTTFAADGRFQHRFDTAGPAWCAAMHDGLVWCGFDGQVRAFDEQGAVADELADLAGLGRPTALAITDDAVVVGDATHRCVRVYDRRGRPLRDLGAQTNTRGFLIPNGVLDIAWDHSTGTVLVAHPGKYRVERYSLEGELLAKFGRFGTQQIEDFPGCCNPTNVAVTPSGHIVVSEKAPPRMKIYTADGRLLAWTDSAPFDPSAKNMDLAADDRGRIYVADTARRTIQVFDAAAILAAPEAVEAGAPGRSLPPEASP